MISLDLNQSQGTPHGIRGTGVCLSNSSPPSNYVIKEIILEMSAHDSDKPSENDGSFWASLGSDVDE